MKPVLQVGMGIVFLALTSYSIAILTAQRSRLVSGRVRVFISLGVLLDLTATICMIIGSERSWNTLTPHAVLGYSSLTGMMIDMILIWRHYLARPGDRVPGWLHLYSRYAYLWWVVAFISGGLLVALSVGKSASLLP